MEVNDAETLQRCDFARTYNDGDIGFKQDGTERTVQAYITPFDRNQEIRDAQGHYNESINPTAFNKTIADRGLNFAVLYNHGRTMDMRPSGALMVPIGVPRLLEAQRSGLYSETEYLDNPLADAVLDGIKKGAIRGYSFYGTWVHSVKTRAAMRGGLPSIQRNEIAMREFGPGLFPVYDGAAIVGVRTQSFIEEVRSLDPEDLDAFRQLVGLATPLEPVTPLITASAADLESAEHDPADSQSARQPNIRALIQSRNRRREIA